MSLVLKYWKHVTVGKYDWGAREDNRPVRHILVRRKYKTRRGFLAMARKVYQGNVWGDEDLTSLHTDTWKQVTRAERKKIEAM